MSVQYIYSELYSTLSENLNSQNKKGKCDFVKIKEFDTNVGFLFKPEIKSSISVLFEAKQKPAEWD